MKKWFFGIGILAVSLFSLVGNVQATPPCGWENGTGSTIRFNAMPYSRILHLFNTSNFLSDTELASCRQYQTSSGSYGPADLVPLSCVEANFLNQRPTAAQLSSTCGVTALNTSESYLIIQEIVDMLAALPSMTLTGGEFGSLAALEDIAIMSSCFNPQCVINTAPVAERPYLAPESNFVSARVCQGGPCTDPMPTSNPTDTYSAESLEGFLPTYSHAIGNLQAGDWVRVFVYSHNTAIQDQYTAQNTDITVGWNGTAFNASIYSPSATPNTTNATNTVSYALGNGLALQAEGVLHRYFRPSFTDNYYEETAPQVAVNTNNVIFGLGSHASSTANINFTYFDFQVVGDGPNYDIEKTAYPAGGSDVYQGESIEYYVTITNTGATPLTTTVVDTYDPNTTLVVENPDNPNTIDYGNGTIGLVFEDVAPGATQTISFFVTVNMDAPAGQVCNSVTDSDGTVSTVCHNVLEIPIDPNFVINKSTSTDCYDDGGTIEFSIEVGNEGPGDLNQIVITDPFDANIAVTSAADVTMTSGHTDWTVTPFVNPTTGNIDYYQLVVNDVGGDGTLAEGEYDTITFTVPVADPVLPDGVTIGNVAWGNAWGVGVRDMQVRNSSNLVTILPCGPGPNYDVIKTSYPADGATVDRGLLVEYFVTLTNNDTTAQTFTVVDDYDEINTTLVLNPADTTIIDNGDGTVSITFENVPAGESQTKSFFVRVNDTATGTFCNTVENSTVCHTVNPVNVDPNFEISKTSTDPCFTPGSALTYSIQVYNSGATDLTNVYIFDAIDPNLDENTINVLSGHSFTLLTTPEGRPYVRFGAASGSWTIAAGATETIVFEITVRNPTSPNPAIIANAAWGEAVRAGTDVTNSSDPIWIEDCGGTNGGGTGGGGGSATIIPTAGICALNAQDQVFCQRIEISDETVDSTNGLKVLDAEGNILFPYLDYSLSELDPIKSEAKAEAVICNDMSDGPEKRECVANWIGRFLGGISCGYPSMVVDGQILDPRPLLDTDGWGQVFENPYNQNSQYQGIPAENILAAQCAGFAVIEEPTCSVNHDWTVDIKKYVYDQQGLRQEADSDATKVYMPNNQLVDYEVEITLGFDPIGLDPNTRTVLTEGTIITYDYTVPAESIQNEWNRTLMEPGNWNYTGGQQFDYPLGNADLAELNDGHIITPILQYSMDPKLAIRADAGTLKNIAFAVVEGKLRTDILVDGSWVEGTPYDFSYGIGNDLMCMPGVPVIEDTISSDSNNAFVEIIRPYLTTMGGSNLGLYETTSETNENLFGKIGERSEEEGFFEGEQDLFGIGELDQINDGNGRDFIDNLRSAANANPETFSLLGNTWNTTADEMEIYFTTGDVIVDAEFINKGKGGTVKTFVIEGNLFIESDIDLEDITEYVAFVVSGNITIGKDVEILDGIYIAGADIVSDDISEKQLVVNGSLVGNIEDLAKNRIFIGDDPKVELEPNILLSYDLRVLELTPPAIEQFLGEGWGQEQ